MTIVRTLDLFRSLGRIRHSRRPFPLTGCMIRIACRILCWGEIESDHLDEEIPYMRYAIWADAVNDAISATGQGALLRRDKLHRLVSGKNPGQGRGRRQGGEHVNLFFLRSWRSLGRSSRLAEAEFLRRLVPNSICSQLADPTAGMRRSARSWSLWLTYSGSRPVPPARASGGMAVDVLNVYAANRPPVLCLIGMAELPGSEFFKVMVVNDEWKYVFMANGGREQLFNLEPRIPDELTNRVLDAPEVKRTALSPGCGRLRGCRREGRTGRTTSCALSLTENEPENAIYQFDRSRGVTGFPKLALRRQRYCEGKRPMLSLAEDLGMGLKAGRFPLPRLCWDRRNATT